MERILAAILLVFNLFQLLAQPSLRLEDATTGQPVVGAFWVSDGGAFGVSDEAGICMRPLNAPQGAIYIRISHLGYNDTLFLWPGSNADPGRKVLRLIPQVVELPEIQVGSFTLKKKLSPKQLVKLALRRQTDNYPTYTQQQWGVYREMLVGGKCPVVLNEAVVHLETSPYGQRYQHRDAWRKSWENTGPKLSIRKNGSYREMGVHLPEGIQYYAAPSDRYQLLASRITLNEAPCNFYTRFSDGPLALVALDKVRLGYDYLGFRSLGDYTFSLVDTVIFQNTYCYHVKFLPSDAKPTKRFGLNDVHSTGVFSGDLYISVRDLAVVHFSATNEKTIVMNNYGKGQLPPYSVRTTVSYRRNEEGRWVLGAVSSWLPSIVDEQALSMRSLVLFDEKETPAPIHAEQSTSEWHYMDSRSRLVFQTDYHQPSFWESFTASTHYQRANLFDADTVTYPIPDQERFQAPFIINKVDTPALPPQPSSYSIGTAAITDNYRQLETFSTETQAYLAWENRYYDYYFHQRGSALKAIARTMTPKSLGFIFPNADDCPAKKDTVLLSDNDIWGFYEIHPDAMPKLIAQLPPPSPGYVTVRHDWSPNGLYFTRLQANRAYNQYLEITSAAGLVAERHQIDDYAWQSDTLYATVSDTLLQVPHLYQWTAAKGWLHQMTEANESVGLELERDADGHLLLNAAGFTHITTYQFKDGSWTLPLGGSLHTDIVSRQHAPICRDMEAQGIPVDFVWDSKITPAGQFAIAASAARQQIWFKPRGDTTTWHLTRMPPEWLAFDFDATASQAAIYAESVETDRQYFIFETNTNTWVRQDQPCMYKYELSGFQDTIVWIVAESDGVPIPVQLRWQASQHHSLRGTLLKVYAAYGNPYLIGYSDTDMYWMQQGYAVAYVQARGSGAQGSAWYRAGSGINKLTACTDYLSVVRAFATAHPLGKSTPLIGYAQSAGGPMLGYVVNEAPQYLAAAIFDHAFLDVVGTMSRPELPLTRAEYPEWGDPTDPSVLDAQLRYSPYQNIRKQPYPASLFLAGYYDQNTPYWQIAKQVAAMRAAQTRQSPILLHTAMQGTHPGTPFGPNAERLVEMVDFVNSTLGFED